MNALLSIHDVMPHTLDNILDILDNLNNKGIPPCTLLVVPGLDWQPGQVDILRKLADQGYELAVHGWYHHTDVRRWRHRIHSLLISRNVAEHLSMTRNDILQMMERGFEWFIDQDLPEASLYVPPAWAMGELRGSDLLQTPFTLIEGSFAVWYRSHKSEIHRLQLPLTGYEADTIWRELFLRTWNRHQPAIAEEKNIPLRICIHPFDLYYRLADQLAQQLDQVTQFYQYDHLQWNAFF